MESALTMDEKFDRAERTVRVSCDVKEWANLDDLVIIQGNLKSLVKEEYEKLKQSILANGFAFPFFIWNHNGVLKILDGTQRKKTLTNMRDNEGYYIPKLPIVSVKAETHKEALRLIAACVTQHGNVTPDGLYEFMHEADITLEQLVKKYRFPDVDFKRFGQEYFESKIVEDEVPETPAVAVTKLGDVWELGDHRLRCGDATNERDAKDIDAIPFMMITDPPYGVDYDPAWRNEAAEKGLIAFAASREGQVANDTRVDWAIAWEWFLGDVAYVWHAGIYSSDVARQLVLSDLEIRSQIIWKKPMFAISRGHYHWQHEPCWYAVRTGKSAQWCGDRSQSTIWEINGRNEDKNDHGTQKPVECMARPMRNHGKEGDLIYDPFGGSGTTLIAATHLNRRCYMLEIEPKYCDVIIERWQNLTGGKATRG